MEGVGVMKDEEIKFEEIDALGSLSHTRRGGEDAGSAALSTQGWQRTHNFKSFEGPVLNCRGRTNV